MPIATPSSEDQSDRLRRVLTYHERTKHHYHRFAASLGFLDWASQPHPFRRYAGSPVLRLPIPCGEEALPYDRLYHPVETPGRELSLSSLSSFLFHSMALSAWKQYGEARWSLRVNPSSGNLHPTECYLVLPALDGKGSGVSAGVYHYAPDSHALERRAASEQAGGPARLFQAGGAPSFLVALTSIHWREAWKYGERAYRYCQHDAGHALGALRLGAALLGWSLAMLPEVGRRELGRLLGVDREDGFHPGEREEPDLVVLVRTGGLGQEALGDEELEIGEWIDGIAGGRWEGEANRLSEEHHEWLVIEEVAEAVRGGAALVERGRGGALARRASAGGSWDGAGPRAPHRTSGGPHRTSRVLGQWRRVVERVELRRREVGAGTIIRQRRSALSMDGVTGVGREEFAVMLGRVVPELCPVPWDAVGWGPVRVHLGLFVHRVEGLEPGQYALARDRERLSFLQANLSSDFLWEKPPGMPEDLPLYLLKAGDVRLLATSVSCGQDIAGMGAFSLGMLAEYEGPLEEEGPELYPMLYWETGVIGQVLYLEAEAAGLRSTGIGCFFDDPVHQAFGVRGRSLQSLYHFTVGGPVDDPRLTTLPAYPDRG